MKSFNFETPDEAVIGRLIGAKGERVRTLREMLRSVSNSIQTRFGGREYWFHPVHLSVHLSVSLFRCLSVWLLFVDMILSTHILGKECIIFPENSTLIICHLKICTWNFHIDWIIFLHFTGTFLFLDLKMCCSWTETLYLILWFTIFLMCFC